MPIATIATPVDPVQHPFNTGIGWAFNDHASFPAIVLPLFISCTFSVS